MQLGIFTKKYSQRQPPPPNVGRTVSSEQNKFEGSVLWCVNEKHPSSVVSRSQLDEICLLVYPKR